MKNKIIFVVGPTAVGKSGAAICLAKKIKAEIISCDSMQIYKGMDILTSKPAISVRKRIPHYLIDLVSVAKDYNAAIYRKEAIRAIRKIIKKGRVPLFVGGTGLYMSVLIDGIFAGPKSKDKSIRERLYQEARTLGSEYLYKRLQKIDPAAALKIHPHDTRRIIRAIEVFESTGQPISLLQKQRKGLSDEYDVVIFGLNMARERLYYQIDSRVEKMFTEGLVKEVKKLLKFKLSRTAYYAIGIKELKGYFDGAYDLEEAKRLIKRNSRHYAKRQLTWFRKDKRIRWVKIKEQDKAQDIAERIYSNLRRKG